jgi:hypothetical protein
VGNISPENSKVGVVVPNDIVDEIDLRAAALGIERSSYAALLFQLWRELGYPALTMPDFQAQASGGKNTTPPFIRKILEDVQVAAIEQKRIEKEKRRSSSIHGRVVKDNDRLRRNERQGDDPPVFPARKKAAGNS